MVEHSKFNDLRIKTEKELLQLINNELDLGIRDARQALRSVDSWTLVQECHSRATRAHAEASRWIPLVGSITGDEWDDVESRLEQLRGMLETLSATGSTSPPAEEEIAALARVFWEARGCPEGLPDEDWFLAERALKSQRESTVEYFVSKDRDGIAALPCFNHSH